MMGNYHVRCGAGEKPEVPAPEAYLSLLALPDGFTSLLSTMRSRNISSVIIIQNMAQIKALFEKEWETIPGNCDTLIFLGGNEVETHKYISELMGKQTIDKRSSSESKGRQGSFSNSFDVLGRELMLPDEVRKMDGTKCLVFIRGFYTIMDDKIHTNELPLWQEVNELEKTFTFDARVERAKRRQDKGSLRLYTDEEIKGAMAEQRKEEEEHQTQCSLAQMEGREPPEKPKRRIIEVSLAELYQSYQEIEDSHRQFDEELLHRGMHEEEDDAGMSQPDVDWDAWGMESDEAGRDMEETEDFASILEQHGFEAEQILILSELEDALTMDEILQQFSPDTIPELMEMLAEDILKEKTQSFAEGS